LDGFEAWLAMRDPAGRLPPPGPPALAAVLLDSPGFRPLAAALGRNPPPVPLLPPRQGPAPAFAPDVPALPTESDLAEWLGIAVADLAWFADAGDRLARPGAEGRRHYDWHWVAKRSGGARLIEAPRPRLKALQRRVLHGILDAVAPHPAAHGFVPGRSAVAAAARHAGEEVVVTADLEDFFAAVPARRVHALFRTLGYPHGVARALTGLTTVTTPSTVLAGAPEIGEARRRRRDTRLTAAHLPQGAPTSPALANLAAWRLDRRLDGLMRRAGGRYTRYADDLAFSGPRAAFVDGAQPFREILAEIVRDEGFHLNAAKTRVMRAGTRQRVTGLTVNAHVNPDRRAVDRLKAILTNCRHHGPASQNREGHPAFRAHLEGRVAWVAQVNPARGRRLAAMLDAIDWSR
ncbi:MAG: reverse transcriptase family protein, partial [Pseudomonadota bacterium]